MGRTDIYRVREKKDVFVLKLLKTKVEGSATARAEFEGGIVPGGPLCPGAPR